MEKRIVNVDIAKELEVLGYDFDYDENNSRILPTYIDVWLWLWRKRKIAICANYSLSLECWLNGGISGTDFDDPEDAIVDAIHYLFNNNLVKNDVDICDECFYVLDSSVSCLQEPLFSGSKKDCEIYIKNHQSEKYLFVCDEEYKECRNDYYKQT